MLYIIYSVPSPSALHVVSDGFLGIHPTKFVVKFTIVS